MNATASPQKTSMMECCLVKTVDAQMSAAQPKASTLSHVRSFASVLPEKAMAMQAELWLLHPFVILVGTALAAYLYVHAPAFVESEGGWLNNPGFHGLGEMLYEFTSCAANNGSGFEGLGDNTWFWNVSCGIVLILSRFIPIIGQVAIAGLLAQKKYIPESAGTLKTDTVTFGVMTFAVIFIVAALSFFPAQALSTIAEHFSL